MSARQLLDIKTEFDVVPSSAIASLKGAAKQLAFLAVDRERQVLRAVLEQALDSGASAGDTAKVIADVFGEGYHILTDAGEVALRIPTQTWSEMVARTELSRASNAGTTALYRAAGIAQVTWMASGGATMCDECDVADGETVALGDDFPGVDTDSPPAHPNCCPPGTRVLTVDGWKAIELIAVGELVATHRGRMRRVSAVICREVCEELIELRVDANVLRLTGNHPVWTPHGWTPAKALQPGDEIRCVTPKAVVGATLEPDEVPTSTAEVSLHSSILGALSRRIVPITAVDLDGKHTIRKCDVDSMDIDRHVATMLDGARSQGVHYDLFVSRFDDVLTADGASLHSDALPRNAADGSVSGCGHAATLVRRHGGIVELDLFALRAPRKAEPREAGIKYGPRDAKRAGDGLDRFAGHVAGVSGTDLVIGQDSCWHSVIVPLEDVRRISYAGLVHNFAVEEDESYIAEAIAVHNCVCTTVPADSDMPDFSGDTPPASDGGA